MLLELIALRNGGRRATGYIFVVVLRVGLAYHGHITRDTFKSDNCPSQLFHYSFME